MRVEQNRAVKFWLAILLIACVAIALRMYAMDRLPPGLFGDEAVEGLDALDVLAGNLQIWFHAHLGREPLYVYLTALSYALFGVTPLATRLPALIAGLATIPIAFFLTREWAAEIVTRERATRLARLTAALLAISFWHVQMTRNAHRDTLLPLVEAVGYLLLWRAFRTRDWRFYAGAGTVLGLAIYTYSPGRFVGVFVAVFVSVEFLLQWLFIERRPTVAGVMASVFRETIPKSQVGDCFVGDLAPRNDTSCGRSSLTGLVLAALLALVVMLPLGVYFVQNPAQFSRRFESVSIFDFDNPAAAFGSSVVGNLAQFVVPGMGYQSNHYNLPGKPVFDLFIAPWFLIGIVIALTRWKQPQYRFLLLWFIVMATPAFLTADMIPKGVRVLGVAPGVFIFPALAMDWLIERAASGTLREAITATDRARLNRMEVALANPFGLIAVTGLIVLSFLGSTIWTTYDYFFAWANNPDVPLAFDSDLAEVSGFIQSQPADVPIYISQEVYRPPTLMLLGERVPTSRYVERATRFKESDARTALIFGARQPNAIYVFIRDYAPPYDWLIRVAPNAAHVHNGEYFTSFRLGASAPPHQSLNVEFNPLLKLVGVSRYADEPRGAVLYWQVSALPPDRQDIDVTLSLLDARGAKVTQDKHRFAVPPLEWEVGDTIVEWYALGMPEGAAQFRIELTRGASVRQSPVLRVQ